MQIYVATSALFWEAKGSLEKVTGPGFNTIEGMAIGSIGYCQVPLTLSVSCPVSKVVTLLGVDRAGTSGLSLVKA